MTITLTVGQRVRVSSRPAPDDLILAGATGTLSRISGNGFAVVAVDPEWVHLCCLKQAERSILFVHPDSLKAAGPAREERATGNPRKLPA